MYNKYKEGHERSSEQLDEIDIRFIYEKIGNGFKALLNKFKYVFLVLKRRFLLIVLSALVGLAIGYGFYAFTKPYYTSSMTLVLAEIRNDFVERQLEDLSFMVAEGNNAAISERLDISFEAASKIKEMGVYNLDQERVSVDSVLTGSPFRIEVSVFDNTIFESLEPALTNYLENNSYFSKQKRIRQREIESMVAKLKQEIASLDSVKATVGSPRGPVNGFVYGEPLNPSVLYRESLNMYEQQIELEAELERLDNIQVVNSFTPRSRPTGPVLNHFLFIAGICAFLLGWIIALVLESRKTI